MPGIVLSQNAGTRVGQDMCKKRIAAPNLDDVISGIAQHLTVSARYTYKTVDGVRDQTSSPFNNDRIAGSYHCIYPLPADGSLDEEASFLELLEKLQIFGAAFAAECNCTLSSCECREGIAPLGAGCTLTDYVVFGIFETVAAANDNSLNNATAPGQVRQPFTMSLVLCCVTVNLSFVRYGAWSSIVSMDWHNAQRQS
jgi:hypothetical protein